MKASSSVVAPRRDQLCRGSGLENAARIHERDAVAAGGLVHEVGRDKNRDALISGKLDQEFPEPVTGDGIDARCRLIEDQHVGLVHDGNRE